MGQNLPGSRREREKILPGRDSCVNFGAEQEVEARWPGVCGVIEWKDGRAWSQLLDWDGLCLLNVLSGASRPVAVCFRGAKQHACVFERMEKGNVGCRSEKERGQGSIEQVPEAGVSADSLGPSKRPVFSINWTALLGGGSPVP